MAPKPQNLNPTNLINGPSRFLVCKYLNKSRIRNYMKAIVSTKLEKQTGLLGEILSRILSRPWLDVSQDWSNYSIIMLKIMSEQVDIML